MPTQKQFIQSLGDPDEFTITYELVPGRSSGGQQTERLLEFARQARSDGRIKALSITDNAGGHPALAPSAIGTEVRAIGLEPLIHFSLKDKNRNQLESHIFLYHRQQFRSLLVLGGDYPRPSYYGQAKPVFDLDSVQALQLLKDMEDGSYQRHIGCKADFPGIFLLRGCVVSPFKVKEAEQMWQYAKLLRKIRAGAGFIVTQLGYDLCKFEELILFLRENNISLPVLGNVFIPSLPVARLMVHGGVPGIVFPKPLLQQMEKDAATAGGTTKRLFRAAKMICVLKRLGYHGVHLGGNSLDFDQIRFTLDAAEEMQGTWWEYRDIHFPVEKTWYLFGEPSKESCGKLHQPLRPGVSPGGVRFHNLAHSLLFSKRKFSTKIFCKLCLAFNTGKDASAIVRFLERSIKKLLFSCQMCGDCTLPESAYLCPQSGCPKKLLNGPCGGSRDTACEVYPERRCFWVLVYERLDPKTTIESLGNLPLLPPKNWALDQSSSWFNYCSNRDHHTTMEKQNKG